MGNTFFQNMFHVVFHEGEMMPINLSLAEKKYIVAVFGDIPLKKRIQLFATSSLPVQAGPAVMRAGLDFIASLGGKVPQRPGYVAKVARNFTDPQRRKI